MPCVHVTLTSSRSCICMRQKPRAHPGRRGRIGRQPQPSFLEATRTGRGLCGWCSTKKTLFSRGGGGGGDCSTPLLCGPHAWRPSSRYRGNYMSACSHCSARYCTVGLANTVKGSRTEFARCRSRNTPIELSHAYLVKLWSLLPGPGTGEAIRLISSNPHKAPHLRKY